MSRIWKLEPHAPTLLIASGALVGVAIVLEGAASRGVNGVAGMFWFLAAALLVRTSLREPARWAVLGGTVTVALVLVLSIRPSDLLWAMAGFVTGGVIIGSIARRDRERTALLLPALWLPIHLTVAVARAIDRALNDLPASVRADPPPTAALLPLTMVVAAYAGGWLVTEVRERRSPAASVERA